MAGIVVHLLLLKCSMAKTVFWLKLDFWTIGQTSVRVNDVFLEPQNAKIKFRRTSASRPWCTFRIRSGF